MKKLAILLALIALVLILTPAVAFANFAIHGGYAQDTDACAGCHRAHTSVSSITWRDQLPAGLQQDHSALLVSNASLIYQFCYACHDDSGQGADTNVQSGVYMERSPGGTHGTPGAPLNGGGFEDIGDLGVTITSTHIYQTADWGAYGGSIASGDGTSSATGQDPVIHSHLGTGAQIEMTCVSCHDPHGSSNYRLLQDRVYGMTVGGYDTADQPLPWVISNEPGYPNGTGGTQLGWLKHDLGQAQIQAYQPDYTTPMPAKAPTEGGVPNPLKGMSGWCAGCHTVYMETGTPHSVESTYDANDGWDLAQRHRHPINISIDVGYAAGGHQTLTASLTPAAAIPLPLAQSAGAEATNTSDSWVDCLTCHYAHGTSATMTGYANVDDSTQIEPNTGTSTNGSGVDPTGDSALLRRNNRGVCEVCHNK